MFTRFSVIKHIDNGRAPRYLRGDDDSRKAMWCCSRSGVRMWTASIWKASNTSWSMSAHHTYMSTHIHTYTTHRNDHQGSSSQRVPTKCGLSNFSWLERVQQTEQLLAEFGLVFPANQLISHIGAYAISQSRHCIAYDEGRKTL